ncbi:MAG: hypothetical protein HYX92_18555 [Chloroflexi bacterium]|nr:hypothetical protein [Chloroflexota bacterium]
MRSFSNYMKQNLIPGLADLKFFEGLVSPILAAKAAEPEADVAALEREIDQLVYRLYGLTREEIAMVEEGG